MVDPVKKAVTWGMAALILVVFVIAIEGIREVGGDNPVVNNTINQIEGSMGIEQQPQPPSNPWKVAFFVLLFLIVVVLLVLMCIWIYKEFLEDNSWTL